MARLWSILMPLLSIPVGFLAPMVIWLLLREDPVIDAEGRTTLDFLLPAGLVQIALYALGAVIAAAGSATFGGVVVLLAWAVWLVTAVFLVRALSQVLSGGAPQYPLQAGWLTAKGT